MKVVVTMKNRFAFLVRHRLIFMLSLYLFVLGLLTLSPFDFSMQHFIQLVETGSQPFFTYLFKIWTLRDMILNLILFMPLGFILNRIEIEYNRIIKWFVVFLIGFIISSLVESAQFFLDRNTNIADVTTNSLGTLLGYFLSKRLLPWHDQIYMNLKKPRWIRIGAAVFWSFAILYILTMGIRLNHLEPWGRKYPLLLGNEATKDRPWQGELYKLVVYKKALKPSQIKKIYTRHLDPAEYLISGEPILAYSFNPQSSKHVLADSSLPFHFQLISDSIHYLPNGGIEIQEQMLKNQEDMYAFYEEIIASGEFSIELQMSTSRLHQTGPARIVSSSMNTNRRNFTIGQNGNRLQFRVCTPQTGVNGSLVLLDTDPVLNDNQKHHVVFTFNRGIERFFWDGKAHSQVIRFDLNYLPQYFHLGQFLFSRFAFLFLLFVPFVFLLHGLFHKHATVLTVTITIAFVFLIEMFFWLVYHQPVSLQMPGFIFMISLIGCFLGACFHQKK